VILTLLAALCLVSVPLAGGQLRRLGEIELKCRWAAPMALAVQVAIITVFPGGDGTLHAAVHIATYGLGALFLWANRRVAGSLPIALGCALNAAAIIANRGVMPASASAQRLAGMSVGSGFQNSAHLAHAHLTWLGDIIPVPGPEPLRNVLSIGDCILFVGLLVLLHRTCSRRAQPPASTPARSLPTARCSIWRTRSALSPSSAAISRSVRSGPPMP
jgi:hypothetical protein